MFVDGAVDELARGRDVHRRLARDRRDDRRGGAGRPRRRAARDRRREPRRRRVGAAAPPFERAAALHRVADVVEQRRERACADADARPGQADLARRATRSRSSCSTGATPPRTASGSKGGCRTASRPGKKVLLFRRPRGVIGVITPWNWPYTMPAELIAPALASGNTVVWTPASTTAIAAIALAECVVEADLPPGVFNLVTGPGSRRRRRDRAQSRHARRRVHRLDRDGPQGRRSRGGQGGRARARRQRPDRRARRRRPRPRRRGDGDRVLPLRRPELHRGRAPARAPRRAGGVRREARASSSRSAWCSATRSTRRDDDGPAEQRGRRGEDGRARRRRARARGGARERRRARRRLPDEALLAGDRARRRPAGVARRQEETFGPVAPVVAIDSLDAGDRARRTRRRTGSCPRSSRATSRRASATRTR